MWLLLTGAAVAAGPGPEVSRSRGRTDGVVVLWPRLVPETEDATMVALAERLQTRVQQVAVTAAPPTRVDVRPAPERVCPMAGCRATSAALMVAHQDGGCAVLAVVGSPGRSPLRLVPLAGRFDLDAPTLEFREPPEGKVVVKEFVPCAAVEQSIDGAALAALFGTPAPAAAPVAEAPPTVP